MTRDEFRLALMRETNIDHWVEDYVDAMAIVQIRLGVTDPEEILRMPSSNFESIIRMMMKERTAKPSNRGPRTWRT